ncbi:MAG: family 20 glycosylhydrolase, partial [Vicingaceae bacterium]|nr:family 20 glycosylhydrolase [Vicingaceae bacterium]
GPHVPQKGISVIKIWPHSKKMKVEEYSLNIKNDSIIIFSGTNEGAIRGIQTLRQLFVDEFHSQEKRDTWQLPIVTIKDAPKFKHRGLLLDCSRHFFEKEVIKKYIDLLAFYKMNVLHWHLTEDQGWRIAIDKYPKLTETGAWRTELDSSKYGGFYTKEEIKEIVAYAQERHITVIPEIELPGHSQAAIAAYPHLSCTGEQVDVANDWGVFKEIYCAGNDSVFIFLEDVLTEVMELFPSEYIHIGGDEAPKFRWEHCPKCQKRVKDENLKNEHDLQSYFISRIEKFLNKNGRQLIGWDEILEGGLSENATVQSWRGMEGGITAANSGHDAIMSPTSHAYFDYDLKAIDLEKVYNFNPIPAELATDKQHYIIGGECNMWTEHVPDEANLDSKVFPRILAMSEVLWSYPEKRNYEEFYNRVQYHYPILKNKGVSYGEETIPVTYFLKPSPSGSYLSLKSAHPSITLKHRFNCETCDTNFIDYNETIKVNKTGSLQIQPYKNEKKYGELIELPFSHHLAVNSTVTYNTKYSDYYTAGGIEGLIDSKLGSLDFRDGSWQGFSGDNAEITLDLGTIQEVSTISTNYYQYNNSWIFLPKEVQYSVSSDGEHYINFDSILPKKPAEERGQFIEQFTSAFETIKIRYIKIKAVNIKNVPDWHEAAGSEAWIFMDEIIVK